jgi:hypothetical protein
LCLRCGEWVWHDQAERSFLYEHDAVESVANLL